MPVPAPAAGPPDQPSLLDELWTLGHLRRYLGRSRSAVHLLVREPDFPRPLLLGGTGRHPVWAAAEVRAWALRTRRPEPATGPHGAGAPGSPGPAPVGCRRPAPSARGGPR